MFQTILDAVGHLGIPPHRHGQSFRIGRFNMSDGSSKGVTVAQFVEGLGYNWSTWSSKSSLYFNVEDLVKLCDMAHESGRVLNEEIQQLEGDLRIWSESTGPLFNEPSASRKVSSRAMRTKLTRILVCQKNTLFATKADHNSFRVLQAPQILQNNNPTRLEICTVSIAYPTR